MNTTVEICCGSFEDALNAFHGGARRIELNSALFMGGLTPSIGTLQLTKEYCDLQVIAMVRPRGAGFCYSDFEYQCMLRDCRMLLENGADGIAFGFLNADHSINKERTREFVELIHSYGKEAVFHRAFDCVQEPKRAMEQLIHLQVDRLLTSGLQPSAPEGLDMLRHLQWEYGSVIQLLAGSGINAENAASLIQQTGISQIHSSCKDWATDSTTHGQHVSYAYADGKHSEQYDIVSKESVEKLIQAVS